MSGKAAQTALAYADSLFGQSLTRVGVTVSAPFGEERNNRVGVATVPGLVVASYDFDSIHGIVSAEAQYYPPGG
jgi:hypothetical protein